MNSNRIVPIFIAAVALLAVVAAWYFVSQHLARLEALTPEKLELMTILGDAQFVPGAEGRFRESRDSTMTEAEREELSKLMTMPYVQGSTVAGDQSNVTIYDKDAAFEGLNVYVSGHDPEAFLINMEGEVLHKWQFDIADVWPEVPETVHSTFWRRVYPFPNGDLLAIYEGIGMIKLGRHSQLKWAVRDGAHHQAFVVDDGRIYVLTRQAQIVESINPNWPVVPDYISVLSPAGELLEQHSVLEAFQNSQYADLLEGMKRKGDFMHTNSIEVFDGTLADKSPLFKKGNVLTSCLKNHTISIIDLEKNEVVWAQSGQRPTEAKWKRQHDPTFLPNGNILFFDNQGNNRKSQVCELNPENGEIVWSYKGDESRELFSRTCSTSRRLPNSNTLITESDNGRAIEIAPDGRIVWEFYNPHRAGAMGELVATLFELQRVEKRYFPWLTEEEGE